MRKLTTEEFITKAKKIHGDKYDYGLSDYKGSKKKIKIICPIHGEFEQLPNNHLNGAECYLCGVIKTHKCLLSNNEEFKQKANLKHNNQYDYSKVEYVNNKKEVCIICKKHGEFYVRPDNHLKGSGCPICKESTLEKEIVLSLDGNYMEYERQKRFKWLGKQSLDFYLPYYNIAIECQGIQHFKPIKYFGGNKHFEYVKKLDNTKYKLCEKQGINILYYANVENIEIDNYIIYNKNNLFINKQMLIEAIKNVKIY